MTKFTAFDAELLVREFFEQVDTLGLSPPAAARELQMQWVGAQGEVDVSRCVQLELALRGFVVAKNCAAATTEDTIAAITSHSLPEQRLIVSGGAVETSIEVAVASIEVAGPGEQLVPETV